ncbi:MAG: hemolysin family protein [Gammaproteobacteria bacterium]|nr:hemolysin family protein [Gammaproteobacteria bacterium]
MESVPLSLLTTTFDYTKIIIYAAIILALLLGSSFFSKTEIVYSSVSQAKLKTFIEENKRGARKALWITENFDRVLSVILIGNNLVNIAIPTLGLRIFLEIFSAQGGAGWIDVLNTIVITLIVLVFGEIIPKTKGKKNNEKLALRYSGILYVIVMILTPIAYPFYKMNNIGKNGDEQKENEVTSDDLENIIDNMEDAGEIEEDEALMLQNVLDLQDIDVKDIMTPRVDVTAISLDTDKEEIKKLFFDTQYSRVPVYKDKIDNIVGVLYEKNFFKAYIESKNFSLKRILNKPLFVVGSMKADSLLKLLKKENVHMAIVLDEYAGFDGIVTMEDTLEELVGEIYDEHDDVQFRLNKIEDNHYLVNGDLELEALFEELDFDDVERDIEGDVTTVGGWVQSSLERVAEVGDTVSFNVIYKIIYNEIDNDEGVEYANMCFKVEEIINNRITVLDLVVTIGTKDELNKEDNDEE